MSQSWENSITNWQTKLNWFIDWSSWAIGPISIAACKMTIFWKKLIYFINPLIYYLFQSKLGFSRWLQLIPISLYFLSAAWLSQSQLSGIVKRKASLTKKNNYILMYNFNINVTKVHYKVTLSGPCNSFLTPTFLLQGPIQDLMPNGWGKVVTRFRDTNIFGTA